MGSCAGCANPQRRYRSQRKKKQLQNNPNSASPNNINKSISKQASWQNSPIINMYQNSEFKLKPVPTLASSNYSDPWKSRINSRSIKKYQKKQTIFQQEHKNDQIFQPPSSYGKDSQAQFMRVDSLQQSVFVRKNMDQKEANQKYSNQFRQQFCQQPSQIKQILNDGSISHSQQPQNYIPYSIPYSAPAYAAYPKKDDKFRTRQLEQIMETFQISAHTPGYVKEMRQEQGQDIRGDNFQNFGQIGAFQWFGIGKYLGEIGDPNGSEVEDGDAEKRDRAKEKMAKNSRRDAVQNKNQNYKADKITLDILQDEQKQNQLQPRNIVLKVM